MADQLRSILIERDVEQAITALKKGSYLLKYGRRGKPKFCPFRLSNDESMLIWYAGKDEKQLNLSHVSRIIPGQRTAIFQRYPRPEKEYQSFSLIYNDRSLDLICKDKDEAEVWFVALKELIANGNYRKCRSESKGERISSDAIRKNSLWSSTYEISGILNKDPEDSQQIQGSCENPPKDSLGKGCSDVILYTTDRKVSSQSDSVSNSLNLCPPGGADNSCGRCSGADASRISLSSIVSSSSQGSYHDDFDSLGDVYIWGEGTGDGVLGGSTHRVGSSSTVKTDALLPKALNSTVMLDVHSIACGTKHAVLVTKKGEVFSWGEESGGRLGHGVEADVSHPKLVDALSGMNIELVACGEYHTSAVTLTGDLYTWGNDPCNSGILGQGSDASHWIPKKVTGHIEGIHVSSVSCGPWHTIAVTSSGQLFAFGDGTFGALGHGDRRSVSIPREVEVLKGMRTLRAACGVWHTAAVVEVVVGSSSTSNSPSGQLFTWGDGDKGRLGHGDKDPRLVPTCIATLVEESFCQVVCGHDITIALTTSGHVYAMGNIVYGQLGSPEADGKVPSHIEGKICNSIVEEIACGSYHIAVLTSTAEVYTWGKGANGRLGHGDNDDRHSPTLVEALKDKQVKSVVCGSNFTAAICLHKWVSNVDQSICSGCHNPFGFRRKRHNCYNCGLVFCSGCSCKKSTKASLAPNINKPYRVCDDCYAKLKKAVKIGSTSRLAKNQRASTTQRLSVGEKEPLDQKLNGQPSKYLSLESFKNNDSRSFKGNRRSESHMSHFTPSLIGNSQWGSFYLSGSSKKMFSASVTTSRMASRATSPASSRPSPSRSTTPPPTLTGSTSAEVIIDDSEQTNGILSPEVTMLRAQVEEVTRKSQLLEAELERTMRQLKEATAIAEEKAAKYKAAKEAIKSLTAQVKDVAGSVPEESQISNIISLDTGDHHDSNQKASHKPESNSHLSNPTICSGTKTTGGEVEWVEQDEPGVYITLSPLPGGGQQLNRVRFSRKRYSEKQAEKWWAENKMRVFKKYNVWVVEKSAGSPQTASDEKNA